MTAYDAVVVGSGPNGLTAAARLASAGAQVLVLERAEHLGGGTRSAELLVPGVVHDVCSAVHPFGIASPAFAGPRPRAITACAGPSSASPSPIPFDDGDAAVLDRVVRRRPPTGSASTPTPTGGLIEPLLARWDDLLAEPPRAGAARAAAPARPGPVRAGRRTGRSRSLARRFRTAGRPGPAGRAGRPLRTTRSSTPFTGALGLSLALAAHAVGWPFAAGGSQAIADALAGVVREQRRRDRDRPRGAATSPSCPAPRSPCSTSAPASS